REHGARLCLCEDRGFSARGPRDLSRAGLSYPSRRTRPVAARLRSEDGKSEAADRSLDKTRQMIRWRLPANLRQLRRPTRVGSRAVSLRRSDRRLRLRLDTPLTPAGSACGGTAFSSRSTTNPLRPTPTQNTDTADTAEILCPLLK